jgi:hypothetical protein
LAALLVVALTLFAALLLIRGHGAGKTTLPPVGSPAAVSESQLKSLASESSQPIYWAGPKHGTYELTRTTDGRTYIRYLPFADKVGDRTPNYLTVGTYPTKQAFPRSGGRLLATVPSRRTSTTAACSSSTTAPEERLLQLPEERLSGRGLRSLATPGPGFGAERLDQADRLRPSRLDAAYGCGDSPGIQRISPAGALAARARMKSRSDSRFR